MLRNIVFIVIVAQALTSKALSIEEVQEEKTIIIGKKLSSIERFSLHQLVITRDDIERLNLPLLSDYLQMIPGVTVARTGGLGGQTSIFMRSSSSSDLLFLIDGLPFSDQTLPESGFQLDHIPVEQIERIEVRKGPSSIGYGSGATAGVINIITSSYVDLTQFALESSTDGYIKSGLRFKKRLTETLSSTFIAQSLSDSAYSDASTDSGNYEKDSYLNQSLLAQLNYHKGLFSAQVSTELIATKRDLDSINFETNQLSDDPNYKSKTQFQSIRASSSYQTGSFTTSMRLSQQKNKRWYNNDPDTVFPQSQDSEYLAHQDFYDVSTLYEGDDQSIHAGLQYQKERGKNHLNYSGSISQSDESRFSTAAYLTADTDLGENTGVQVSLRQDNYSHFGTHLSYSLQMSYDRQNHRLSIETAKGFKAPSLYQIYGLVINDDLKPEDQISHELRYEYSGSFWKYEISMYQKRYENAIEYIDYNTGYKNQSDTSIIQGVETQLQLSVSDRHELGLWMSSLKQISDHRALVRRPKKSYGLSFQGQLTHHNYAINILRVGERDGTQGKLPEYTKAYGSYSYTWLKGLQTYLRVENIFNEPIIIAKGYSPEPRRYFGGVKFTW